MRRTGRGDGVIVIILASLLFLSPDPPPAGSLLLADLKCSPVRLALDVRAVAMIAWLISSLTCLLVVDLTVPSPRCRLVWRGEERAVFIPGSVMAICRLVLVLVLVVPSRRRGSYPWRLASMSCPSCLILFACYHYLVSPCVSFLISLCVSLQSSCLRCVFLVSFSSRSRGHALARFVPVPVSFRRLAVPSRRASREAAVRGRHVLA